MQDPISYYVEEIEHKSSNKGCPHFFLLIICFIIRKNIRNLQPNYGLRNPKIDLKGLEEGVNHLEFDLDDAYF